MFPEDRSGVAVIMEEMRVEAGLYAAKRKFEELHRNLFKYSREMAMPASLGTRGPPAS
jgi:hypothetical protein